MLLYMYLICLGRIRFIQFANNRYISETSDKMNQRIEKNSILLN